MGEKKKQVQSDKRALYRKYRSKSLDEIVGQEHITKTLSNALKKNQLSHAYLFTGPRGVGKTSIARILAHEINEIPYTDDSTHLDIIEIDAASNRRIDDIRDLREKVNLAPVNAKYKVYIIDEVHMLTPESFNALLKTLEEPPAHAIFILATTEAHKLPATIISRTQRHTFRAVPYAQVVEHLGTIAESEGIKVDNEALALLAEHGEGSFRDSISLLDQISHLPQPVSRKAIEGLLGIAPSEAISEILNAVESGDTVKIVERTRSLQTDGIAPSATASQLLQALSQRVHNSDSVKLMKDLLAVNSSQQPALALEVALLSSALKKSPNEPVEPLATKIKTAPNTNVSAPAKAEEPTQSESTEQKPPAKEVVSVAEKEQEKPKPKKTSAISEETLQEFWPDILATVKERNSSLYTVMRLAKPSLSEDSVVLTFRFPFHKKRAEDTKHVSLMSEIISNQFNGTPEIVITLDEKGPPQVTEELASRADIQAEAQPDPAHASLIASVQDIMGGGEVVDARNT